MKLKILIILFTLLNLFCEDEPKIKKEEVKPKPVLKIDLKGFSPTCTTITDEVIIKVFTKKSYNKDSVNVKISFENMMAKIYPVCTNMKLNFPLYPVISPSVEIIEVVDSMDYQFDTLGPGESIIKEFDFSRYCKFDTGTYNVSFLFTTNAFQYKDEKLKGIRLSSFVLNIR